MSFKHTGPCEKDCGIPILCNTLAKYLEDREKKDEELFKLFSNIKDDDELFREVLSWYKRYCSQELKREREEGWQTGYRQCKEDLERKL